MLSREFWSFYWVHEEAYYVEYGDSLVASKQIMMTEVTRELLDSRYHLSINARNGNLEATLTNADTEGDPSRLKPSQLSFSGIQGCVGYWYVVTIALVEILQILNQVLPHARCFTGRSDVLNRGCLARQADQIPWMPMPTVFVPQRRRRQRTHCLSTSASVAHGKICTERSSVHPASTSTPER